MKPACMDPDEYAAWQEANARLRGVNHVESPCRDCTPLFHADSVAGGMCDGQPLPSERPRKPLGRRIAIDDVDGRRKYWRERRRASRERARAGV